MEQKYTFTSEELLLIHEGIINLKTDAYDAVGKIHSDSVKAEIYQYIQALENLRMKVSSIECLAEEEGSQLEVSWELRK